MENKPLAKSQDELDRESIRECLLVKRRTHTLRTQETSLSDRIEKELLVVIVGTEEYLKTGETLPRLEDVKDYLRGIKGNPYGMDIETGGADAKVQKDMLRVCRRKLLFKGLEHDIVCKELNKNAIVFFDITIAEKMIATEKDKTKVEQMKERMTKVLHLKTREGYERLKF